jgi:cobalt-zinc-cadmium efflux system outer membrane protein
VFHWIAITGVHLFLAIAASVLLAGTALPARAQPAAVSLAQAVEAAWQRAVEARESDTQARRARAEQTAASSLWAAPPAIELNHLSDRRLTDTGRRDSEVGYVWPLWMPGQRDARQAAADADLRFADSSTAAARLRVAGQVREAAWLLSAAQAEAASAQAQASYLQRIADDVQRRVTAGDLARADALAARGELLDAQAAQGDAHQRVIAARAHWLTITGLQAMPMLKPPDITAVEEARAPREEHPELRAASEAVERARRRLDVVNTSRRDPPEVTLRYREEAPGFGEGTQRGIGVGLRIPFGTDGRNAPLQAAAIGDLEMAETTQQRLRERRESDATVARAGLQSAHRQVEIARTRAVLLRERAQLIDASFKAGESSLPELLRAVNAAGQADAALARQQAALGMAHAQLQQTLGLLP